MNRSKCSKTTSINIPNELFVRIDLFAKTFSINRNSAMIYLLSRGLEYECDFEDFMKKKEKNKTT